MIYALSGATAGAVAGAAVGFLGSLLAGGALAVIGTLLGAGAAALGIAGLLGFSRPPIQRDRETPKEWVERGPIVWPILNGAALGFGATTRLGFWLWYAVPIGCFLIASPIAGVAIWGIYGFTRTASASGLWLLAVVRPSSDTVALLLQRKHATAVTSALLSVVGMATFFLMGL